MLATRLLLVRSSAARHVGLHARNMSSTTAGITEQLKLSKAHAEPRSRRRGLVIGSVCYAESIASIWKGMMRHFARHGLDVDFVLYTNYERQINALMSGEIDISWSGPLAHARAVLRTNGRLVCLGMRDVDRDFTTHVVVREDANIDDVQQLNGRRIASGTVDSPQAYIMPFRALARAGVDLGTLTVFRYDRDIGKHGDTAYGEDAVLNALQIGIAEAGFISDLMWQRYVKAGNTAGLKLMAPGTVPPFDHCQFDALPTIVKKPWKMAMLHDFQKALLAQKMDGSSHFEDTRTMELEGIKKEWLPHRAGTLEEYDYFHPPPADPKEYPGASADPFDHRRFMHAPSKGYEGMMDALDLFGEHESANWPGVLHTTKRHPFKHLMVDYSLVRDALGC